MTKVNKYQNLNSKQYSITGLKCWDMVSDKLVGIDIIVFNDIPMGITLPPEAVDFYFNHSKSIIKFSHIKFDESNLLNKLKEFINESDIEILKKYDIYEVNINSKVYYHIKDIEDGNFIGLDSNGHLHEFIHDPFEIKKIQYSIVEYFNE